MLLLLIMHDDTVSCMIAMIDQQFIAFTSQLELTLATGIRDTEFGAKPETRTD